MIGPRNHEPHYCLIEWSGGQLFPLLFSIQHWPFDMAYAHLFHWMPAVSAHRKHGKSAHHESRGGMNENNEHLLNHILGIKYSIAWTYLHFCFKYFLFWNFLVFFSGLLYCCLWYFFFSRFLALFWLGLFSFFFFWFVGVIFFSFGGKGFICPLIIINTRINLCLPLIEIHECLALF